MKSDCQTCIFKSKPAVTLDEDHLSSLSCNNVMVKFKKGDLLIKQGAFSTNVAYLRSGLVKIHISGPYYEQIVKISKATRFLGLPTTIGDKINQYSVTALSDVEVCYIDILTFKNFLRDTEQFAIEIILDLCQDNLESLNRCAKRTQKNTRGNIADLILDLADNIFESDEFVLPVSQKEVGNLVDASRESVSRILTEFHNDGIIEFSKKRIKILNKKSLVLISING